MDGVPERSTVRESAVGGDRGGGPVRFRLGRAVRAAKAFHQADRQRAVVLAVKLDVAFDVVAEDAGLGWDSTLS